MALAARCRHCIELEHELHRVDDQRRWSEHKLASANALIDQLEAQIGVAKGNQDIAMEAILAYRDPTPPGELRAVL